MNFTFGFWVSIMQQGLIMSFVALGVYITYKLLDFPDLSTDGTFVLGAAVGIRMIMSGVHPMLALFFAFLAGMLAGLVTGSLNVYLRIANILSGIIVMTALYSVNIRVLGMKSNQSLKGYTTIFTGLNDGSKFFLILGIVVVISFLFYLFLKTKLGYMLKATGDNPQMVTSLGVDKRLITLLGVGLANAFVALSGAMYAQYQNFTDVTVGQGMIIRGLAAIIIGSALIGKKRDVTIIFLIIGAISYEIVQALAIKMNFIAPSDYKLVVSILFVIILVFNSRLGGKKHATN